MSTGTELWAKLKQREDFDWASWHTTAQADRLINDAYKRQMEAVLKSNDNAIKFNMLRHLLVVGATFTVSNDNVPFSLFYGNKAPFLIPDGGVSVRVPGSSSSYYVADVYTPDFGSSLNEPNYRYPKYDYAQVLTTYTTGITSDHTAETITVVGSAFQNGATIMFTSLTGTTGLSANVIYYVKSVSGTTFQVSLTFGGSTVTFSGSNISAATLIVTEGIYTYPTAADSAIISYYAGLTDISTVGITDLRFYPSLDEAIVLSAVSINSGAERDYTQAQFSDMNLKKTNP